MNRSIMFGVLSILTTLVFVGGTTYALFSSQASNNGNTFGAGTLTLTINGAGGGASTPVFTVPSIAPGEFKDNLMNLANTGTVDASSVKLSSINIGGANPQLADKLTLTLFNDVNGNGQYDGGETILGTAHLSDPVWTNYTLPSVAIPHGDLYKLGARITFDSDADNNYQGLSTAFNLNFQANQ